jgi:hypothetical protein
MNEHIQNTILIPAAAALITGALAGCLCLALGALASWPLAWSAIVAAGSALASWFGWSARFARIVEYRLAPGLPQLPPAPMMDPRTLNLHIHREDEAGIVEGAFLDRLPVNEQGLAALAGLVLSGGSLTTSQITAGGLMTRSAWEALRDRFVSAGLLQWRGGNRQFGVELTARGWSVFRRLAVPYPYQPARIEK